MMDVRHVRSDDAPGIGDILQAPHVVRGTMRLPYQTASSVVERIADREGAYKLVATIDGSIAGYAELLTYSDLPRHRHAGEINMIASHPAHRGKGVGEALMRAMLDLADNWLGLRRVGLTVWADNTRALRLYEEFDFKHEGRLAKFVMIEGVLSDAVVMARFGPKSD
jgi:putative acetyltransferase